MARSEATAATYQGHSYRGLRGWLEQVDKLGELERVSVASWDAEMGGLTQMQVANCRVVNARRVKSKRTL